MPIQFPPIGVGLFALNVTIEHYLCGMSTLNFREVYWREKQPWLLSCGYELRARYQPDWTPSWITTADPSASTDVSFHEMASKEDFAHRRSAPVIDAIRLKDRKPVMLKKIFAVEDRPKSELAILKFISSPELTEDPENHCLPIYDVLTIPGDHEYAIVVMPLLRRFDSPRFDTIGECLEFFHQIFKGIQFLHRHRIAHCDCSGLNVMMDGSEMYPDGFHPVEHDKKRDWTGSAVQKYTRTQRPPKYYWIDFGLSIHFDKEDKHPRAFSLRGNDKSVPEFQDLTQLRQLRDPFPTDIYYLGNLIRTFFTEGDILLTDSKKYGLEFLNPLVQAMVQEDMSKRPTIDQCVIHLEELIRSQSSWTLRAQIWHSTDNPFGFLYRLLPHWACRIYFIFTKTPAVPSMSKT